MIVYLHVCHVFPGEQEQMREDGYIIPLCASHHARFDRPRGDTPEGLSDWYFIGTVMRYFLDKESRTTQHQEVSA